MTGSVRFETFGKQKTTGIRPGNVLTLEFAGGKEVVKGLDLALRLVGSTQVTRETGSAVGTDTRKYRFFSVGPGITWRPKQLPGAQIALRAAYEFGSRNTSEGVGTLLSFAYTF
jgi:hypothetical protein